MYNVHGQFWSKTYFATPLSTDLEAAMALIHDTIDELSGKWRIKKIWDLNVATFWGSSVYVDIHGES